MDEISFFIIMWIISKSIKSCALIFFFEKDHSNLIILLGDVIPITMQSTIF